MRHDIQSLLQVRSHLVLRKAHIVLRSLGNFSDPKGGTQIVEKRTSRELTQCLVVILRSGKVSCFEPGGVYDGVPGMPSRGLSW